MKTIVALLAITAIMGAGYMMFQNQKATQDEIPTFIYDSFNHWKNANGKVYGGAAEQSYRLSVYAANFDKVKNHQQKSERTFSMKVNKFADLTSAEFSQMYLGLAKTNESKNVSIMSTEAPASVDWRTGSTVAVGPVKDQGQCGSCWAFSTVGSLEGASALFGAKQLQSFSESQLVDCSSAQGNQGCNGGLMDNAFKYVEKYGITTEDKYPYKAVSGKCKTQGGAFKIKSFTDVAEGDVAQLAAAVAQQPVSIAVDANNFQFYDSGVFSDCQDSLDHGVTLVGYTSEAWIVKNSWGESWGESGYIRLKRGNTCGLANAASYPVL